MEMEDYSKFKMYIASTAVAIACAGITYAVLKHRSRLRDAVEALNYLKIKTIASEQACDEVVHEFRRRIKVHRAVGFDCEWVTTHGRRQPVALLQLSTYDGLCGLFRLCHMKTVPKSLKDLLEDETIYKVGVAPGDDGKYLCADYSVGLRSALDIRHLAALCGHRPGGLGALAKSQLHIVLDKSWRIRCSDWEADDLSSRQLSYAAADAHVAVKIFVNLVEECGGGGRGVGAWLWGGGGGGGGWSELDQLCGKYADVHFKTKQKQGVRGGNNDIAATPGVGAGQGAGYNNTVVCKKKYPHATRSKPLYHNCFLEAPDGELLCTIDNKKAMWYAEKCLGEIVREAPLTVRLRFEPAGRSVGDVGRYYTQIKANKCVVCGATNSYIRKNVVPREYRKYFPEIMKDHSSHDVVLLCAECHQASNMRDQAVRERLAAECAAPLAGRGEPGKHVEDAACKKVRSAARALLHDSARSELPAERREQLALVVRRHYRLGADGELTLPLLREAADIQVLFENAEFESHGARVSEYFLSREGAGGGAGGAGGGGGLLRLERVWREHFLASMRPRHMPPLWSVTHNEERLRVKLSEGRLSVQDLKSIGISTAL